VVHKSEQRSFGLLIISDIRGSQMELPRVIERSFSYFDFNYEENQRTRRDLTHGDNQRPCVACALVHVHREEPRAHGKHGESHRGT